MKNAINNIRTEIYPIIAPPRTCSTMLGASINMNSKIDGYCHEPFFRLRDKPDSVSDSYEEIRNCGEHVVVKDMTQWLDINREFVRFFNVSKKPPVFLIRNPIIATEDKLTMTIKTFDMREKKAVTDHLHALGFNNLDGYAASKNFKSWRDMLTRCFNDRDYRIFGDILRSDNIFNLKHLGWESLSNQIEFLKSKNMKFLVIDADNHKKNSIKSTKKICDFWELDYEDKMVNWGEDLKIETGQNKAYQTIWYERLINSNGIQPPVETKISSDALPDFIADYIVNRCIPIYERLKERINTAI